MYILLLWNSMINFKYFPPYVHHFCLSFITVAVLSNMLYLASVCSKDWYVFVNAGITGKLIFWRWKLPSKRKQ